MEKETTGVYITGHPLDDFRDTLAGMEFSTAFLADLGEAEDGGLFWDGRRVRLGGILTDVRHKVTKAGSLMGFVVLEDLTGQIEGLVFPRTWEKISQELAPDLPVVLSGRLSVREDDGVKLIVEEVRPLINEGQSEFADLVDPPPAPDEPPPKLYLRVPTRRKMNEALNMLAAQRGGSPVYFRVEDEHITLLAPASYCCRADSELMQTLRGSLGNDNVRLVAVTEGGAK